MVCSKHPYVHWSISGQTSQGSTTLGSFQQVPLDHSNSVGFGVCRHDVSPGGAVCMWPFLQSLFHFFVPVLPLDRNISGLKTLRWVGGLIYGPKAVPIYRMWALQVLLPPSLCISAKVIPIGSWEPHISQVSGTLQWLSLVPHAPYNIL